MSDFSLFNVPDSLITRYYPEENTLPGYRTQFMRDRDRLMYATAFRRLAGKTQIYTVGADDHKKNRLTHTLEVAQISRTIAKALGLDCDLSEAIALAHDFGHTPFGHAGEEMLHEIMMPGATQVKNSPFCKKSEEEIRSRFEREQKNQVGYLDYALGFKHNLQSVRVCALLEDSYRGPKDENIGLNLTNFTLYGMMTHSALKYKNNNKEPNFQDQFKNQMKIEGSDMDAWSFEAYIVKLADDVAQWHHDLEDALREGILPVKKICSTIENSLGEALQKEDKKKLNQIKKETRRTRKSMAALSHIVVNTLVNEIIEVSKENLLQLKAKLEKDGISAEQLFRQYDDLDLGIKKDQVITLSDKINKREFEDVIKEAIHHSRNVSRMNEKGKYIIRKLFEAYYAHPQQLPDGWIFHLMVEMDPKKYKSITAAQKHGVGEVRVDFEKVMKNPNVYFECLLMRRICDHIASMTDHYAIEEYNNLYG